LRLDWSDAALDDLHRVRAGLSGEAAARIGRIIVDAADCLIEFPEQGRMSGDGSRELPLPGLPWRLVYRTGGRGIIILRMI